MEHTENVTFSRERALLHTDNPAIERGAGHIANNIKSRMVRITN
jgi:hypothetical protein